MLNYDHEADTYDVTRGGADRAAAAAVAVESLLPPGSTRVADLACGTGIVTMRLRRPGRQVVGIDLSPGMAAVAAVRLPGRIAVADTARTPLADASTDAVVMIWLLHLLEEKTSAAVLAEAARVLRPGGGLLTTVDKGEAQYADGSDIAEVVGPARAAHRLPQQDSARRVADLVGELGLVPDGRTVFVGRGQGRSPRQWRESLLGGHFPWARDEGVLARLCERLGALPDQDEPRPDPVHRLVRFVRAAG